MNDMSRYFKGLLKYILISGLLLFIIFIGKAWMAEAGDVIPLSVLEINEQEEIHIAISQAILSKNMGYAQGEVATEGHQVFGIEQWDDSITVYMFTSFGWFGFENGIFTKISGSSAIPTVMKFLKQTNGQYSLLEYTEAMDGGGYMPSIKKMFPDKLVDEVILGDTNYTGLLRQQEAQAEEYLKSIGRTAQVRGNHVEKQLVNIDVEASNKLFSELTKYNEFLNSCPYWIGSRERVEDGVRYIYETSQGVTDDGFDIITFSKSREDGTIVEEARYKIIGTEPKLSS